MISLLMPHSCYIQKIIFRIFYRFFFETSSSVEFTYIFINLVINLPMGDVNISLFFAWWVFLIQYLGVAWSSLEYIILRYWYGGIHSKKYWLWPQCDHKYVRYGTNIGKAFKIVFFCFLKYYEYSKVQKDDTINVQNFVFHLSVSIVLFPFPTKMQGFFLKIW